MESPLDLITEDDLQMWVSFAFVCKGSMESFVEIRKLIQEYLKDKPDEEIIYPTSSGTKLFIVKERDYEYIQNRKRS